MRLRIESNGDERTRIGDHSTRPGPYQRHPVTELNRIGVGRTIRYPYKYDNAMAL